MNTNQLTINPDTYVDSGVHEFACPYGMGQAASLETIKNGNRLASLTSGEKPMSHVAAQHHQAA
jgi:hypothetical protein